MKGVVLHPISREALQALVGAKPHAILLVAPAGMGKGYAAQSLAAELLNLTPDELVLHPYYSYVSPENGTITIDSIRGVQQFTRLKTTGKADIRRVIVIENAHTMTIEAQNALLKLLEEPPADTLLILTTISKRSLRPTIISRMQGVEILRPPKPEVIEHFNKLGYSPTSIERTYAISGGNVGLMSAVLSDSEHSLASTIEQAKTILRAPIYERLCMVDQFSKQRDEIAQLLHALSRVCSAGLEQSALKNAPSKTTKQWLQRVKAIQSAQTAFAYNPSNKLLLTDLFLHV